MRCRNNDAISSEEEPAAKGSAQPPQSNENLRLKNLKVKVKLAWIGLLNGRPEQQAENSAKRNKML